MKTQLKQLTSTNIDTIWYDQDEQVLTVKFLTGRTYEYYNVEHEHYDALLLESDRPGGSYGKYINQLKKTHTATEVIEEDTKPVSDDTVDELNQLFLTRDTI